MTFERVVSDGRDQNLKNQTYCLISEKSFERQQEMFSKIIDFFSPKEQRFASNRVNVDMALHFQMQYIESQRERH
jgi:uncharacterized protein YdaU (DUF1376 family)